MSVHIDAENPWPGLEAFDETSAIFFKGRDRESIDCSRLVKRERLSVLLGKSGVGKSSLLKAGVFPLLAREGFAPIYVRLNHQENEPELTHQVKNAIRAYIAEHRETLEAFEPLAEESLWEYFHRRKQEWWNTRNEIIVPVVVFDQFEEIMTLGTENAARRRRSNKLLNELEELVEGRVSEKVQMELASNQDLAKGFSERFDVGRTDFRVVLTLREDFLAEFEELRVRLKPIGVNRFRLLFLERVRAMEAICKPNPKLVKESVAQKIINRITASLNDDGRTRTEDDGERRVEVDPALLSVFCSELNQRRVQRQAFTIDETLVDEAKEEILASFYERAFSGMEEAYRSFVEDKLLTISGARDRFAYENALALVGITERGIQKLINRRLLRIEASSASTWLELSHDAIAAVAQISKRSRNERNRLLAEQLDSAKRANAAEALAAEQREQKIKVARELKTRSRQRRQAVNAAIAALLLLVAYFAVIFTGRWALVEDIKRMKVTSALLNQEIKEKTEELKNLQNSLKEKESSSANAPTLVPVPTATPISVATPTIKAEPKSMSTQTPKPRTRATPPGATPPGIFYDPKNPNSNKGTKSSTRVGLFVVDEKIGHVGVFS